MLFLIALVVSFQTPSLSVSISQGESGSLPSHFTPIEEVEALKIKSAYWARVHISFEGSGRYVLTGGNPNMQQISFYDEQLNLIDVANNITLEAKDSVGVFYLFYHFTDEKDKKLMSISISNEISFIRERNSTLNKQLIFHSVLLFPLLAALFFFSFNKQVVYLYYALYILSMMFFFGYQYGIVGDILPIINEVPPIWIWFFSFIITVFYLLFSIAFLDLQIHDRFSVKLIYTAIGFILFFFLVSVSLYSFGIDVQRSITYKAPFLIIELFLIIWFVKRTIHLPYKIKYYYLVGFIILFIISMSGQFFSASQSAADYNHLYQAGLVVEVFVLTLGLGAKVDELQKEKNRTQSELITQLKLNDELQKKYTEKLEKKVIERTQKLDKRNRDNELLLKEIHHRVKNNLQMITSMINMYHRRSTSGEISEVLASTKNKIKSMALIHEHLYSHADFSKVVLNKYLTRLTNMIISSLYRESKIQLDISIQKLVTDIQTGISLGLIINELVTNSIKYGLTGHPDPKLTMKLLENQNELELIVEDNGNSIQCSEADGLGFTIIKSILENMDGELLRKVSEESYRVEIKIKDYKLIE